MAKPKKRNNGLPPFVAIPWKLLNSNAYKRLPGSASKALPYFLGKPKLPFNHPDYLTSVFEFTYPEAVKCGFAKGTFARTIEVLILHGFIDPVEKGGLRGSRKSCSKFRLSNRWEDFGKPEFKRVEWASFVHDHKKE